VTAEPKVHVFSRSENVQEIGFSSDIPSSSEGIMKWSSSEFLVTPTLGQQDIWGLIHRPQFAMFATWHGATETAFPNRQFLCMFAPSATSSSRIGCSIMKARKKR